MSDKEGLRACQDYGKGINEKLAKITLPGAFHKFPPETSAYG